MSELMREEVRELMEEFKAKNSMEDRMTMEEQLQAFEKDQALRFSHLGPFKVMIMDKKWTLNTTTLRRIRTAKVLLFAGNCKGVVSYGKGRGSNMGSATRNAYLHLNENMIAINLDQQNTWPKSIYAKFGKHEIVMWSRRKFDSWGSPRFAAMIQMAGIRHCKFKVMYAEPNPYNLVYCFMKLFTQNTTTKHLAEQKGEKLYDTIWARKQGNENNQYSV